MHRLGALRHPSQVLADGDPRPGGVGGYVAVEADPIDRAVGALLVPVVALVELGGQAGELELQLVGRQPARRMAPPAAAPPPPHEWGGASTQDYSRAASPP